MVQITHSSTAPLSGVAKIASVEWNGTHTMLLSTTSVLVGRYSSGAGAAQEIGLGSGLQLAGGNLISDGGLEYYNVKSYPYNATGDGVTDDAAAIQAAINAANAAGGGIVFLPSGTYRKTKASATITLYDTVTLQGTGDSTIILFDDVDSISRRDLFGATDFKSLHIRDLKILGVADAYPTTTNASQVIEGVRGDGVFYSNVSIENVRYMATAFSYVNKAVFYKCRLDRVLRDGIRCTNSYDLIVIGCDFTNVSDDSVAFHSLDAATVPVGSGLIVTGCTFEGSDPINALGGKVVSITNNVFKRSIRTPISVNIPHTSSEGNSPILNIDISNNLIIDTFSIFGSNTCIEVTSYPVGGGSGSTQPGVNASIFDHTYNNNIDASGVNIGAHGVNIKNNIIARTLPAVTNYSDYGFGDLYDWNVVGWQHDPAITNTSFNCNGIAVYGSINGLNISGNQISGLGPALYGIVLSTASAINYPDFDNVLIESNIIKDCPGVGVGVIGGDTSAARNLIIRNNILDLDPFFRAATHNSDNTWSGTGSVVGIQNNSTVKGIISSGNTFKHCDTPISNISGVVYAGESYVYCQPVAIGDNASNKGVRNITATGNYICMIYDGDPTSATFGNVTTVPLSVSAAMPTTGFYVEGHFVKNSTFGITIAGSIIGWKRLTTGSGHTLRTDWMEVIVPIISGTGTPEAAVTAPIGYLYLRQNALTGLGVYFKSTGTGNTGWLPLTETRYGSTAQRPSGLVSGHTGLPYFDTTLGKIINWNGSAWVDATGTAV